MTRNRRLAWGFFTLSMLTWGWVEAQVGGSDTRLYRIISGQITKFDGSPFSYCPYTVTPGTAPGTQKP